MIVCFDILLGIAWYSVVWYGIASSIKPEYDYLHFVIAEGGVVVL